MFSLGRRFFKASNVRKILRVLIVTAALSGVALLGFKLSVSIGRVRLGPVQIIVIHR